MPESSTATPVPLPRSELVVNPSVSRNTPEFELETEQRPRGHFEGESVDQRVLGFDGKSSARQLLANVVRVPGLNPHDDAYPRRPIALPPCALQRRIELRELVLSLGGSCCECRQQQPGRDQRENAVSALHVYPSRPWTQAHQLACLFLRLRQVSVSRWDSFNIAH
jgi:hypothetical protein